MSDGTIDPRIREFRKHTYLEGKRTERLRYLEPHKLEQATDELDRMAEQTDELAAELSRSLLPLDARERIARWFTEQSRFDSPSRPISPLMKADSLLAALSATSPEDKP